MPRSQHGLTVLAFGYLEEAGGTRRVGEGEAVIHNVKSDSVGDADVDAGGWIHTQPTRQWRSRWTLRGIGARVRVREKRRGEEGRAARGGG